MGEEILKHLAERLERVSELVRRELAMIRTGRAKPALVEEVKVEAYGSVMSLKELASITAPDPSLLLIAPWDKSLVAAIVSGIQKAELNLSPVVDGQVVKLPIPVLTEERRKELVKQVHHKVEEGKVLARQVRSEVKEEIEAQEGAGGVSEDDIKGWLKRMQEVVDREMVELERLAQDKEQELLTI